MKLMTTLLSATALVAAFAYGDVVLIEHFVEGTAVTVAAPPALAAPVAPMASEPVQAAPRGSVQRQNLALRPVIDDQPQVPPR